MPVVPIFVLVKKDQTAEKENIYSGLSNLAPWWNSDAHQEYEVFLKENDLMSELIVAVKGDENQVLIAKKY